MPLELRSICIILRALIYKMRGSIYIDNIRVGKCAVPTTDYDKYAVQESDSCKKLLNKNFALK